MEVSCFNLFVSVSDKHHFTNFIWLWLPWLRFLRAFSLVVRQIPGYNSPRRGTVRTLPKFLCCSRYCLFCVVLCIVCVQMCTVLLPPDANPNAVNKYIISYHPRCVLDNKNHRKSSQTQKIVYCSVSVWEDSMRLNTNTRLCTQLNGNWGCIM